MLGATQGANDRHGAIILARRHRYRPRNRCGVMRSLGAIFVPLAILGERSKFAVAMLDDFEIGIRRVDHIFARCALTRRHVGQERLAWRHQVLHPIRAHVSRQNMVDFSDLATDRWRRSRTWWGLPTRPPTNRRR